MTINILTIIQDDAMVMCADSMLTLQDYIPIAGGAVVTTFENAEKIIELGGRKPAAAMISGSAAIGERLVSSYLRDASRSIDRTSKASDATIVNAVVRVIDRPYIAWIHTLRRDMATRLSQVDALSDINTQRKKRKLPPLDHITPEQIAIKGARDNGDDIVHTIEVSPLTIVVCTYFASGPRATELRWPGCHRTTRYPGSVLWWWGSGGSAISRLITGFDFDLLTSHVDAGTPDSPKAKEVIEYADRWKNNYQMPTPVSALPLQDAVEFTEYLGQVACGYDKFKAGPAGVGGTLELLVLRRGLREWVKRKRVHSAIFDRDARGGSNA
jgi:hypothetical protein